jgi:superfamily II DNA helicase RecQ
MQYGLTAVEKQTAPKTICLVVAPLVSLMKDQISSLRSKGVSAICIGPESTSSDIEDIKSGKYNLIFGSPEALLNSYRTIFRGYLKKVLGAVFIDESHCIEKW